MAVEPDLDRFQISRRVSAALHRVIPGGCHTYVKGDDQFPLLAPGVIVRGKGCRVWDADGNEYVEYGMGCRAVGLGHAYPEVIEAAAAELARGSNFSRPAAIELECATELLGMIPGGEMVKFAKDGSAVTTAAVKLARAITGRDMVALCADHPFFATNDWFIGTTGIPAGVPEVVRRLSVTFRYNDIESLRRVFKQSPDRIACVILEPSKNEDPVDNFLQRVHEVCREEGALFILDEMITGFRYHANGAQALYGVDPDLSCFGKAMANGFALSALVGKRRFMEVGGLYHDRERVFLLSTTHGAETHAMAAAIATMKVYQTEPVVETLDRQGRKLLQGLRRIIASHGLTEFVTVAGKPCNLVFGTRDPEGQPSQAFRALLMQELIARGVLGPTLVISYSHGDQDLELTFRAFEGALPVYRQAIEQGGVEGLLVGRPTQIVYRSHNDSYFREWPVEELGPAPASSAEQI